MYKFWDEMVLNERKETGNYNYPGNSLKSVAV